MGTEKRGAPVHANVKCIVVGVFTRKTFLVREQVYTFAMSNMYVLSLQWIHFTDTFHRKCSIQRKTVKSFWIVFYNNHFYWTRIPQHLVNFTLKRRFSSFGEITSILKIT